MLGIHPKVKLVACMKYIVYGDALDREDENLCIAAATLQPMVRAFNRLILEEFGGKYLNR